MDTGSAVRRLDDELRRRVQGAREAAGLTQAGVRARLEGVGVDIGKSAYAKLERGERGITFTEAMALARVLNFTVDDLMPAPADIGTRLCDRAFMQAEMVEDVSGRLKGLVADCMTLLSSMEGLMRDLEQAGDELTEAEKRLVESIAGDDAQAAVLNAIRKFGTVIGALGPYRTANIDDFGVSPGR